MACTAGTRYVCPLDTRCRPSLRDLQKETHITHVTTMSPVMIMSHLVSKRDLTLILQDEFVVRGREF